MSGQMVITCDKCGLVIGYAQGDGTEAAIVCVPCGTTPCRSRHCLRVAAQRLLYAAEHAEVRGDVVLLLPVEETPMCSTCRQVYNAIRSEWCVP